MAKKTKPRASSTRRYQPKAATKSAAPRRPKAVTRARPRARRVPIDEIARSADSAGRPRPEAKRAPRTAESDPFRPPAKNTRVYCLHCQEKYDSYRIEWRELPKKGGGTEGFWCCPIEGCDGKGFMFDIHPTDPNWEDEEDRGMSGGWFDDDGNPTPPPFADVPW